MSLQKIYENKWTLQDLTRQVNDDLKHRGHVTELTRYAQAVFQATIDPTYQVAPRLKNDFKPFQISKLPDVELYDYYTNPIDMHKRTLAWVSGDDTFIKRDGKTYSVDIMTATHVTLFDEGRRVLIGEKDEGAIEYDWASESITQKIPLQRLRRIAVDQDGLNHLSRADGYTLHDPRTNVSTNYLIKDVVKIVLRGNEMLLGQNDNSIQLYDKRKLNEPISTYNEHTGAVRGLKWLNEREFISGGGKEDGTLKIWDKSNQNSKRTYLTDAQVLDIHEDSKRLYTIHGHASTINTDGNSPIRNNPCYIWKKNEGSLQKLGEIPLNPELGSRPLFSHLYEETLYVGQPFQDGAEILQYHFPTEKPVESLADRFSKLNLR